MSVAVESDMVQMSRPLIALQRGGHGRKSLASAKRAVSDSLSVPPFANRERKGGPPVGRRRRAAEALASSGPVGWGDLVLSVMAIYQQSRDCCKRTRLSRKLLTCSPANNTAHFREGICPLGRDGYK